ncbi:MAG: hypothetical protein SFV17_01390 [Candidatus Obscuribacter sp.]|nr:hypothetical protein [Candidatus Obscuribacter sp.]
MLTDSEAGEPTQDTPQPWLNPYAGNAQNVIAGKFQSLLFYHEVVAPALIELHAINHLLSYCGFGLTMAGDKNGDGRLELFEVKEYIQDLLQITGHDKCLVKGLNSLERNYNEIAGPKNYIDEQDLIVRENYLNKLIQTKLLENEAILEQLAECEPDELEELDLCVIVQ